MRKFICWAFSWEALFSEEAKKNNKRSATEARRDNFAKTYFHPLRFSRSVNARLTVRYFIVLLAEKKAGKVNSKHLVVSVSWKLHPPRSWAAASARQM